MKDNTTYIKRGDQIGLVVDEPWELVTSAGSGPFRGKVVDVDENNHESIVFKLDQPLLYQDASTEFFRASTRSEGAKFATDSSQGSVVCNIVSMTNEEGAAGLDSSPQPSQSRLLLIGDISWPS
jgi:hypothetical protein